MTEEELERAINAVFDAPLRPTTYVLPKTWLKPFLDGDWRWFRDRGIDLVPDIEEFDGSDG